MEQNYEDIFKEIITHGARMGEWSILINHYTEQPNVIGYTNEIHGYKVYRNDRHGIQLDWTFKTKRKALEKFRETVRFEFDHCVTLEKSRLRRLEEQKREEEARQQAKVEAEQRAKLFVGVHSSEKDAEDAKQKEQLAAATTATTEKKQHGFLETLKLKSKIEEHKDNVEQVRDDMGELMGWTLGNLKIKLRG